MLWVDKHRPSKLDDLCYNDGVTERLRSLAKNPAGMPHLFFYGPPGCGKKTRIVALLRQLFGPGSERLKLDKRTFTTPTNRTIEINLVTSNYHIELSPGDAGLNDRYVVQDIIKEMASNKNIVANTITTTDSGKSAAGKNNKKPKPAFKVVVLSDVDRLSRQAQAALRRTMEKCASTCRLVLCCNSQAKLIEPVRSRCLGIRVKAPTHDEICTVLQTVAKKENIGSFVSDELAISIARESSRNLRRALLMLEACVVQQRGPQGNNSPPPMKNIVIPKTDWEMYLEQLAREITNDQSPQRLVASREKLYELLVNCVPADVILKTLTRFLLTNLDDSLKREVTEWAAFYEHRIALGSKEIFHLEAFIAKFMAVYKRFLNEMFG